MFSTFDIQTFAQREIQPYQGRSLSTTDLAKILSRVPKRYREQVVERLLELHTDKPVSGRDVLCGGCWQPNREVRSKV